MARERQKRRLQLLEGAFGLEGPELIAYLDAECVDDPVMRQEVLELLQTEEADTASFSPAFSIHQESGLESGRTLGSYRIVRLLERGGMGSVYLAEREDFEKQVALKVIRRGLDLDDILVRRFHNERQILARLEHPHIARLLDGGTTEDQLPYFVMEYVDGVPIHEYCRSRRLPVEERVSLFRKVCRAVHFAHQNLVIHRDLKPSNILIGDDGEPKLLDFGIAKLLDEGLADRTVVTGSREGLMTPRYASPEQVAGKVVSTTSDVYSLGVLLYELLTGVGPYKLTTSRPDELARAVCDVEVERPSRAVARLKPNDETDLEPGALSKRLRGDLDTIVLKTLEKRPDDRYGSAQELAEDLRRHVVGLPVEASTDSWTYRARKFVRRHWVWVAVWIAFLALSTSFGVHSQKLAREARDAQNDAEVARARAEKEAEEKGHFVDMLQNIIRGENFEDEALDAWERLTEGKSEALTLEDFSPDVRLELEMTFGARQYELDQDEKAEMSFQRGHKLAQEIYRENRTKENFDKLLTLVANKASGLFARGNYRAYLKIVETILALRIDADQEPSETWKTQDNIGNAHLMMGKFEEAEKLYLKVRKDRLGVLDGLGGNRSRALARVSDSEHKLASLYWSWGKLDKVSQYLDEALKLRQQGTSGYASSLDLAGRLAMSQGNWDRALQYLDRALELRQGLDEKKLGRSHMHLADLLLRQGESAETVRRHLDEAQKRLEGKDPDHWELDYLGSLEGFWMLSQEGREQEAVDLLEESHEHLTEIRSVQASVTRDAECRLRYAEWLSAGQVASAPEWDSDYCSRGVPPLISQTPKFNL